MVFSSLVKSSVHMHTAFEKVVGTLTNYIEDGLKTPDPESHRTIKWILGPSRCGKSQALDHVYAKYEALAAKTSDGKKVIPVLKVTMRSGGTKAGLAVAILEAMGMANFARGSAGDKFDMAIRQLINFQVKVLLIDEIQQMTDAGRSKSARGAADVLKELFERVTATIVCIGLPNAADLYKSNSQLANRSERRVLFMPYDFSKPMQFRNFLISIKGFYDALEQSPHLIQINFTTFARSMYYLSAGRFGIVINYMHSLHIVLSRSGDDKLSIEKLHLAAEMIAVDFDLLTNVFDREISDEEFSMRWEQMVRAENIENLVDVAGRLAGNG